MKSDDIAQSPFISVIVPVYNVEKYLPRCIDSILAQSFSDFELLLVNDGSTDFSGSICDEYAEKDSRIRVFHKENGGVSSARNLGLNETQGEWIAFIDADDWISENFLWIDNYLDADIIQKSYCTIHEFTNVVKKAPVKNCRLIGEESIHRFFVTKRNNALWDKIISKKVIKDMRFNEESKIGEDFLFFLSIIRNTNIYAFSSFGNYNYVIREGSAMQQISEDSQARIQVLMNNVNNVNKIIHEKEFDLLRYGIIYSTYANNLFSYRKQIKETGHFLFLYELFAEIEWKKLYHIPTENIIKLYVKKLILSLMYVKLSNT